MFQDTTTANFGTTILEGAKAAAIVHMEALQLSSYGAKPEIL